ncbi:hypothetical protein ACFXGA_08605 [Actinosynnema sp. NPDC059335]|uniref:hypothetical protein n=1 Tax=Actinosynnema sp. NPDC059335 TaxID=3346804 RepID=UPI00366FB813
MQYRVTLTPPKPKLTVKISADSAQKFSAKIIDLDLREVHLRPDGSWIDKALLELVKFLVDAVIRKLLPALRDKIKGKVIPVNLKDPIGYTVTVGGTPITFTAKDLDLGTHEGNLLVTGRIEVGS